MDTTLTLINALGFALSLVGAGGAGALTLLHIKNATTISSIFQKVATLGADVAVVGQKLNLAALTPVSIAGAAAAGAYQAAQDLGLSAKDTSSLDAGITTAAKVAPIADLALEVAAPSVEEKAHAILDQVGQVITALSGVTKQMQATAAAQASMATPPAPALTQPSAGG